MKGLKQLYRFRFSESELPSREAVWKVLCEDFFQRYVNSNDTVLDLGCGFGEFIRFIEAQKKIAIDINEDGARFLPPEIEYHAMSVMKVDSLPSNSIDVCFVSNLFEHLSSKDELDLLLSGILHVLKPGGILIALQPNIKYCPGAYWDFYDHNIPLSHLSCGEAFVKSGFEITELIGRFLPYTTKSAIPKHRLLVRLYLRFRPLWLLVGKQFLIVGKKAPSKAD
jgi:SAM-dependent methyltransferase